jgi:sugar phosphate isomerase/epimerase
MKPITRKTFVRSVGLATASLLAGPLFAEQRKKMLLSFSTLGCPDWSFPEIVNFAVKHDYKGIEVRGIQRELDLTKSPVFNTDDSRRSTLALMAEKKLQFVGLGSSANLHLPEGAQREKSLVGAKQFIDLAAAIRCPYVRVFPNNFPKEQEKAATIDLIVKGLVELGNYAKNTGVMVLLETHGDVVKTEDLLQIMQTASHPQTGLVWDVSNMWTVTKENPVEVHRQLMKYIRHTHIKDAKLSGDKLAYTLLGEGDVPISDAIRALSKSGYKGYYSFEWEKLWHPEIAAPEIALAHYPKAMKKYL